MFSKLAREIKKHRTTQENNLLTKKLSKMAYFVRLAG
jgi:hypothetical protein